MARPVFVARVRLFKLACAHVVILPLPVPKLGDKQWCQRCADYTEVYSLEPMFHTRCRCRAATRSHKTGKDVVMTFARKHTASKPTHLVEVYEDEKKVAEVRNTEDSLFSSHSDIRAIAEWNQSILRGRERPIETVPSFDNGQWLDDTELPADISQGDRERFGF